MLQSVAECRGVVPFVAVCCEDILKAKKELELHWVAVSCSCVVVCCTVLQCVAVYCNVL